LRTLWIFAASALLAGAEAAFAQELGDPQKGLSYAEKVCAECHAVLAEEDLSPTFGVPPFRVVANTPGMTETALNVWFQTPHPSMPNLVIPAEDLANVIAYILSLKEKR
jgi:mono/diheme cytochrome c family protein